MLVAGLETPTPLLGVYALETLGLKVDPRTGELEEIAPEGGYLLEDTPSPSTSRGGKPPTQGPNEATTPSAHPGNNHTPH